MARNNTLNKVLVAATELPQLLLLQNANKKCGPMPNVMAAMPNIGGTLCSTPQFG